MRSYFKQWLESLHLSNDNRRRKPAGLSLRLERLEDRTVPYAVSGNAWPHPELITIGFVPDGTVVGSDAYGTVASDLFATFDSRFGSTATWQNQILKAAQLWAQQTNINFAVISDDGSEIGSGLYQQGDPNMADIRIGGYNFGTTILAQAASPAPVNNYSVAGDLQFNTGQTWNIGSTYDLFTVSLHEIGHTLGLYHSAISTAVMYGNYTGTKTALSTDDVSGIRAVTGYTMPDYSSPGYQGARRSDSYDAAASNGTSSTASNVTSAINTTLQTALIEQLNITATGDIDYFKFTVPAGLGGMLSVKAQSTGLSLLAPTLTLYNNAMTQLATQAAGSTDYDGTTLSVGANVTAGQTYYVKVAGLNATAFGTGNYALALGFAGTAAPVAASPDTQTLYGTDLSGGGGQNSVPPLDLSKMEGGGFHTFGPDGCDDHDHERDTRDGNAGASEGTLPFASQESVERDPADFANGTAAYGLIAQTGSPPHDLPGKWVEFAPEQARNSPLLPLRSDSTLTGTVTSRPRRANSGQASRDGVIQDS